MDLNKEKIKDSIFYLIITSLNTFEGKNKYLSQIDANKILHFSKKFEYIYEIIYIKKSHCFQRFKRNFKFLGKYLLKTKVIKLKKIIKSEKEKALSYFIIQLLKFFIDNENHKLIQKILMILLKLSIEQILPNNIYLISIELILNILIKILVINSVDFCYINDEIYKFAEDIVSSLISFSNEIKIQISKSTIIIDVINLLDEYLFSQNYPNIILSGTPIWLKLLEINFSASKNPKNNSINSKDDSINKKINIFLSKIYKFSLTREYIEKILFKRSILNIQYYNNYMNFLKDLFWEEFDNNNKTITLKLFINENGFLTIDNGEKEKLKTEIKINENSCYLLCISINKTVSKMNLFANKILGLNNKNENVSGGGVKDSIKISDKLKISNSSKEFSITVGKTNFIGIIGEFFFINKEIKDNNIENIFVMKEKYANIIKEIYYHIIIPPKNDKNTRQKNIKNKPDELSESKDVLKQLNFEIIFEMNLNDILYSKSNKFLKKIDNDNNNINIKDNTNINQVNLKSVNILNNNAKDNSNFINKKNIHLIKNLSKMNYSYDIFYQNYGLDFITFQLYNIFSKIDDNKILNFYLNENLSFVRELIGFKYLSNQNHKTKNLNSQMRTYFLTLLILLYNKKDIFF